MLFAYNYNQERNEAYFNDPQQYVNQVFWLGSNNRTAPRDASPEPTTFPIGKGKKFGSSMHPILNAAFGGWQMSGIYSYRSGEFLRFGQMDYSAAIHTSTIRVRRSGSTRMLSRWRRRLRRD